MSKSKIQVLLEAIDPKNIDDSEWPSDVHIVEFIKDDTTVYDAVRAYTMVDIFDEYYDNLKGKGHVVSIKSGYGVIRPNLYGKIKA